MHQTPWQATVDPCLHWRLLDTHRQVWLSRFWGHSSCFLVPGVHTFKIKKKKLCPLRVSASPVLWKFSSEILLVFKVKFSEGSQSLCWIPRLRNLLWALELLQQCENFFGIIVLQFVRCLLSVSMVGLMATSSKRDYATCCVTQVYCTQSSIPNGRPLLTRTST